MIIYIKKLDGKKEMMNVELTDIVSKVRVFRRILAQPFTASALAANPKMPLAATFCPVP